MGKSEKKSNWKRKFRALKREKNNTKELLKLNAILENKSPIVNVTNLYKTSKIEVDDVNSKPEGEAGESMQLDRKDDTKIYNSKTKLNNNGNYPPWMNQRSIKKLKKRLKPSKK
jgi:hypothetical protein